MQPILAFLDRLYNSSEYTFFHWRHPYLFWMIFHAAILAFLAIDLLLFRKKLNLTRLRDVMLFNGFWIVLALVFNGFIYYWKNWDVAMQFFTAYVIEKSLSIDNLFVFLAIFTYFKVPLAHQKKVLCWGIIGALLLRVVFILVGISLIKQFHWVSYALGAFLVFSGARFFVQKQEPVSEKVGWLARLRFIPTTQKRGDGQFFVKEGGQWKMTYLFAVLLVIECADVIFAVDSIPAVLSVTTDAFIAYTSNVFAILGLRSLYFTLASSLEKLKYLKSGLSAILVFTGLKMLMAKAFHVPVELTLVIIFLILAVTVVLSRVVTDAKD